MGKKQETYIHNDKPVVIVKQGISLSLWLMISDCLTIVQSEKEMKIISHLKHPSLNTYISMCYCVLQPDYLNIFLVLLT